MASSGAMRAAGARHVAILNVGRVGLELERPAIRVHHRVPLASLDLLAAIVAPHAAALGRLDALAVDHGRGRAGFAPDPLAVTHDQVVVDGFPRAVIAQPGEPAVHGAPRREAVGHQPPRDAATQDIADAVDDFPHRVRPFPAAIGFGRQKRQQDRPFGIGQVASIAQPGTAMLPPGGRGPHRGLVLCVATSTNHDLARPPSPSRKSCRTRFET